MDEARVVVVVEGAGWAYVSIQVSGRKRIRAESVRGLASNVFPQELETLSNQTTKQREVSGRAHMNKT